MPAICTWQHSSSSRDCSFHSDRCLAMPRSWWLFWKMATHWPSVQLKSISPPKAEYPYSQNWKSKIPQNPSIPKNLKRTRTILHWTTFTCLELLVYTLGSLPIEVNTYREILLESEMEPHLVSSRLVKGYGCSACYQQNCSQSLGCHASFPISFSYDVMTDWVFLSHCPFITLNGWRTEGWLTLSAHSDNCWTFS